MSKVKQKIGGFFKRMFAFSNAVGVFHGTLFLGATSLVTVHTLSAIFPVLYVYLSAALGGTVAYFLLLKKAQKIDARPNEECPKCVEDNPEN